MPLDLSFFLLALEQISGRGNGFDLATLALVESAWQSSLAADHMFGWVVSLMNGQRLYLELEVSDVGGERSTDLEIADLAEHQRFPDELEDAVAWYRPDNINQHLGLAGRFVH